MEIVLKFDWMKSTPLINPVTRNGSANFFSMNTTTRSLTRMTSASFCGKPTDIMRSRTKASRVLITFFVLLCALYRDLPAEAFVASSPPLSRITATGSRCGQDGLPATGARAAGPTKATARRLDRVRGWRTQESKQKGWNEGVRSLRAGLDFPSFSGPELVESLGRGIAEQSVKHHWQSGFTGGSVGVIGTLVAIQLKVNQVKELTACPYCHSTGQLPCAVCFGSGAISITDMSASTNTATTTTLTCPGCRGKTYVACINCKGDGRGVPLFLNNKVSRDPESEIEDVGYA